MGLILLFIVVTIVASLYTYNTTNHDKTASITCATVLIVVFSIITTLIVSASWAGYIELKQTEATIQQYKEAISLYVDKAKLDITDPKVLTDLKYNEYQNSLGRLIMDYRNAVNEYNKNLISRQILNNNIMLNWLIIGPDPDMTKMSLDFELNN